VKIPPDAPDALTLAEVLERLLPLCDDSVFEVATWLNDHAERGKVKILGDGKPMHPASVPSMLKVDGFISPTGEPYLKIQAPYAKQWAFERETFEANRPNAPRNRGGRPVEYPRERIVTEALIYIAVNGAPATLDGEGGLFEKLELGLKPSEIPKRNTLYNIFNPIWKRIEDERKRIEDMHRKSKKPGQ
jgi:hypothetical protein